MVPPNQDICTTVLQVTGSSRPCFIGNFPKYVGEYITFTIIGIIVLLTLDSILSKIPN